ncbi:hypothetical protein F0562_029579 [Nyssa sinensis]|uniref:Uncharacterized protein n=1 Tax=Nyssa sinensis TaxID=561372 RepID=A0A5J5B7G2_9ASTE|nr:hypothetical protein F0562_029579 [Nyssa sinensis]
MPTLRENNLLLPSIDDALKLVRKLSMNRVPGKLARVGMTQAIYIRFVSLIRASHIMATLGWITYESHGLEAQLQLQLQLLSATEVEKMINDLKNKMEETEVNLGTTRSLVDSYKEKLVEFNSTLSL